MYQCQRVAKSLLTQYILYCELEDVLFSKGTFTVHTSQYWLVVEHLPHPSLLSIIFTHVVFTCFSSSSSHANTIICLTHCNLSWIFFMIWFDVWAKILDIGWITNFGLYFIFSYSCFVEYLFSIQQWIILEFYLKLVGCYIGVKFEKTNSV